MELISQQRYRRWPLQYPRQQKVQKPPPGPLQYPRQRLLLGQDFPQHQQHRQSIYLLADKDPVAHTPQLWLELISHQRYLRWPLQNPRQQKVQKVPPGPRQQSPPRLLSHQDFPQHPQLRILHHLR